jgi:hypothetical protein
LKFLRRRKRGRQTKNLALLCMTTDCISVSIAEFSFAGLQFAAHTNRKKIGTDLITQPSRVPVPKNPSILQSGQLLATASAEHR